LFLRDLLLPALWVAAWLGNGYVWRGNRITASARQETQLYPGVDDAAAMLVPDRGSR
jgi:hypothetical protein